MHQHYDGRQRAKQKTKEDKYRTQQQFLSTGSQAIGLNSKTTKKINKTFKIQNNFNHKIKTCCNCDSTDK